MSNAQHTAVVMKLRDLEAGEVFRLAEHPDVLAVKSEYAYDNEYHACLCVLLGSGEYAHFCQDKGISTAARVFRHEETPVIPIDVLALINAHDKLVEALKRLVARLDDTEDAETESDSANAEYHDALEVEDFSSSLHRAKVEAEQKHFDAAQEAEAARQAARELLAALALAGEGEKPEPCPVCGSKTHDADGHRPHHD